jgi:hypothetical protein
LQVQKIHKKFVFSLYVVINRCIRLKFLVGLNPIIFILSHWKEFSIEVSKYYYFFDKRCPNILLCTLLPSIGIRDSIILWYLIGGKPWKTTQLVWWHWMSQIMSCKKVIWMISFMRRVFTNLCLMKRILVIIRLLINIPYYLGICTWIHSSVGWWLHFEPH